MTTSIQKAQTTRALPIGGLEPTTEWRLLEMAAKIARLEKLIAEQPTPLLCTIEQTVRLLGFKSRTTLWKETALGKIKQSSYSRYHISEIKRYAAAEAGLNHHTT